MQRSRSIIRENRGISFLILALFLTGLTACSPPNQQQAYGTLERERISLLATSNEVITALPIKEGSVVKTGQILVQLETTNQQAIVTKTQAQVAQQQANLNKILNGARAEDIDIANANLASMKAKLTDAQKYLNRVNELVRKNLASRADKDNALAARDAAQGQYDSAYNTWQKLTHGSRIEDIELAQAQLAAVKSELALQQNKLEQLTVVATRDGILDSLPYHLGERVPQNAVVAILQANNAPYARIYVPEPHKHAVQVGQKFWVHIDGVEAPIQGIVRWLSVEPAFTPYNNMTEEDRSRLVYLAELDMLDAGNIATGIPVQVDLTPISESAN